MEYQANIYFKKQCRLINFKLLLFHIYLLNSILYCICNFLNKNQCLKVVEFRYRNESSCFFIVDIYFFTFDICYGLQSNLSKFILYVSDQNI